MQGKVKFFNQQKGFGFLHGEDGIDYFVGVTDIKGSELLNNGDQVTFEVKEGKKGPKAVNVLIQIKAQPKINKSERDDRIECPSCHKMIVPRLVTYKGKADRSLCPFCGSTVKNYSYGCLKSLIIILLAVAFFFILELNR